MGNDGASNRVTQSVYLCRFQAGEIRFVAKLEFTCRTTCSRAARQTIPQRHLLPEMFGVPLCEFVVGQPEEGRKKCAGGQLDI
jgi:hypothetical protein